MVVGIARCILKDPIETFDNLVIVISINRKFQKIHWNTNDTKNVVHGDLESQVWLDNIVEYSDIGDQ